MNWSSRFASCLVVEKGMSRWLFLYTLFRLPLVQALVIELVSLMLYYLLLLGRISSRCFSVARRGWQKEKDAAADDDDDDRRVEQSSLFSG